MKVVYLPGNQVYGIMLDSGGGGLVDLDGQFLYHTKQELREALHRHGLRISGNKIVTDDGNLPAFPISKEDAPQ